MKEHFIDLTDGTRLEIKVNFGTLYFLQKCKGFYRISKKVEKAKDNVKAALSEEESFDAAADVIYAILRSNGKAVTWEEAMCLVPADPSGLEGVLKGFQEEVEKYHKKKAAKTSTMPKRSR